MAPIPSITELQRQAEELNLLLRVDAVELPRDTGTPGTTCSRVISGSLPGRKGSTVAVVRWRSERPIKQASAHTKSDTFFGRPQSLSYSLSGAESSI